MKIKSGIVSRILSQGGSVHDEGLTVNFPRKKCLCEVYANALCCSKYPYPHLKFHIFLAALCL